MQEGKKRIKYHNGVPCPTPRQRNANRDIPQERVTLCALRGYDWLMIENRRLRRLLAAIPIETLSVMKGQWAETVRLSRIAAKQRVEIHALRQQREALVRYITKNGVGVGELWNTIKLQSKISGNEQTRDNRSAACGPA